MKTHEQILSLMTKSHAQAPMQFNSLLDISGLQPDTLNMVLDQMYDARKINQAKVTRAGIEQREVWPVAIVNKANPYRSGVATAPVIPPPRRNEAPAIKPVQLIKTEEAKTNSSITK